MQPTPDELQAVLTAAERLLSAREDQMVTAVEWDALQAAIAACSGRRATATESYRVEGDSLIRSVVPRKGDAYQHSCGRETYEAVAHAIDDRPGEAFTAPDLTTVVDLPFTQVNVAFQFLVERGCLTAIHGRRHIAATRWLYLDGMIEWHALREGSR